MVLLAHGDYAGYDAHCVEAKSDARDAGQVFRYLRGELEGKILDFDLHRRGGVVRVPAPDLGGCSSWRGSAFESSTQRVVRSERRSTEGDAHDHRDRDVRA